MEFLATIFSYITCLYIWGCLLVDLVMSRQQEKFYKTIFDLLEKELRKDKLSENSGGVSWEGV